MKKTIMLIMLILCSSSSLLLTGCSSGYKDGIYSATASDFADNGWKDTVTVTIIDGKLDRIQWDGISNNPDIPINKKQYSKSGLYGMLQGGAHNEWCDQAKAAEDYILAYGVDSFALNADGHTDAISGCTVEVDQLAILAKDCLQQAQKSK